MPRYYGGNGSLEQYGGSAFDPLTGRLNGGQLVMQVLNQIAGLKKQKQQDQWDIEDRDLNNRYKEASIRNLDEPNAIARETINKPSAFQEWMTLGKDNNYYGGSQKEWALLYKRNLEDSPEEITTKAKAKTEGVIAGGGTVGGGQGPVAYDPASIMSSRLKSKIDEVKGAIQRYASYVDKRKEARGKLSTGNRLGAQVAAEHDKAISDAERSVKELERYKSQLEKHITMLKPGKPVDPALADSVNADYPTQLGDIVRGGWGLDIDQGQGPAPVQNQSRFVEVNGKEVELTFNGKHWVSKDGKIKAEDRNGQLFPVK